jgi:hypothetical protein
MFPKKEILALLEAQQAGFIRDHGDSELVDKWLTVDSRENCWTPSWHMNFFQQSMPGSLT